MSRPRTEFPFAWPSPPMEIALIEPEIPPNTGNIARLCAATGTPLHLVEPLGFDISDKAVKRAGLDYWKSLQLRTHANVEQFDLAMRNKRCWYFTTGAKQTLFDVSFLPGDVLVFGSESRGLDLDFLAERRAYTLGIPIQLEHVRSLNLSNAVSVALYEACRQIQNLNI